MKRLTYALGVLVALAIVVAGCGGGESSSGGAYSGKGGGGGSTQAAETSESGAKGGYGESTGTVSVGDGIVSTAKVGDLGTILVDSQGMTLYDFHKDKGGETSCYEPCAASWPPLLTEGEPQAQGAADRSLLGTTERKDGQVQVTYNGWPLYTYVGDSKPGEATGNDISAFGAQWYALMPNGEEPAD